MLWLGYKKNCDSREDEKRPLQQEHLQYDVSVSLNLHSDTSWHARTYQHFSVDDRLLQKQE